MDILTAVFLGIVQGLTEFLPVSSSGHLVLFETLFGFDAESPEMLLFDLATHVGTVAAVLIVFHKPLYQFLRHSTSLGRDAGEPTASAGSLSLTRVILMVLVANFCTGILVLPLKKVFTDARGSLLVVALMLAVTGTLLWLTDRRKTSPFDLAGFGLKGAALVGLAQGVAVLPGISRSGATIGIAVLLGLQRSRAVEFSMLIGIPAILGATLLETAGHWPGIGAGDVSVSAALAGAVSAAVVGVGALKLLLVVSKVARLRYFGFYCYALSVGSLIYLLLW
ncbi:MAG TPA: undecaprenyl-diphosphate phosphatase [Sedimentisphaerales bacterium]|nr:undecaprenyl-diphosphate phosphatase [Sedimentisphaerales bacterium]HRS10743.1 undecaprenyl-diphosphate phosphatase [Sedimentisphaerales bacterium]HRV47448.1 undecaprenyl-diphosphate phosphatase [Sedimentisphaerales bacterium]